MNVFLRLVSYSLRYRARFTLGVVVSFFVAVFNGLSLTAFVPLFDALGDKELTFMIQFSERERAIIRRALVEKGERIYVPGGRTRIGPLFANDLDRALRRTRFSSLDRTENFELDTIIRWKLKINAARYSPQEVVYAGCAVVLPLYLLKLLLLLISVRLIAGTGYLAVRDLRRDLYSSSQRLPLTYYYREKTGLLMSRVINDAEVVSAVISSNMRDAITNVFIIITHLGLLAYFNLELLIIAVLSVPLMLSPVTLFTRKIRHSTTRSQNLLANLNAHVQESISGMRVIRSLGAEAYALEQFRHQNERFSWKHFKLEFYLKGGPNLVELTSALVTIFIIALGAIYINNNEFSLMGIVTGGRLHTRPTNFSVGEFMAFLMTLLFIIRPIIQLASMHARVISSNEAGKRIFEIIDHEPEARDPEHPLQARKATQALRFEHVSFVYPGTDREVLTEIDLEVPVGSTVALVGESGSGKSTLVDLLARFFSPTKGRILIDGQNIEQFRLADHRGRIGIVTQEIFLFYGTVHENIAYGRQIDRREVEKAARLAHAHDFILTMANGYDTVLGERGITVSGGQRQRIAIARALLLDPEILILDEATSALDTESERLVQHALERLFRNRTTFVIAHRLSTIENADLICVVSGGRIVDQGKHAELMARGGLYARLQEISRASAGQLNV